MRAIPFYLPVFFLFILYSCSEKKDRVTTTFQAQLVGIWVSDLEESINWYVDKMGFVLEKDIANYPDYNLRVAFVQQGDFHIELLEKNPSYEFQEVVADQGYYLGGPFKIGFAVPDIEKHYELLQSRGGVEFITGIGDLPANEIDLEWPAKYFLIQDPDGNYIQFFSFAEKQVKDVVPWLLMITVDKLQSEIEWYETNLGFETKQTVGEKGNRRAILARGGCVLELFEPDKVLAREELSADSTVLGYNKLAFGVSEFKAIHKHLIANEVSFAVDPEDSEFPWASRSMIVKDKERNWIQFFEVK